MSLRKTVPVAFRTNSCLSFSVTRTCKICDLSGSFVMRRSKNPRWTSKFSSLSPSLNALIRRPGSGVTQARVSSSKESSISSFLISESPVTLNDGILRIHHSKAPNRLSGDVTMQRNRHCQK